MVLLKPLKETISLISRQRIYIVPIVTIGTICHDSNTIRSHLVRNGFMENYMIWDHHGERRTEASNHEVIAPEVREDDDVHLVMMHDDT
jgi:hypothetical protein